MMKDMKKVLTIAGSDSGGGAGIQADIKTITLLGSYGMSVITALTAQNTVGIEAVLGVPESFVGKQIDAVLKDIGADAVKVGMLANAKILKIVAGKIRKYKIDKVIVDPVMVAKSGHVLLSRQAHGALKSHLLPLTFVLTPNIPEASALCGIEIRNLKDLEKAAKAIYHLGPKNVLIKGGHLEDGKALDLLYDGKEFFEYTAERIETKNTHGTGCSYSAAISTFIAQGEPVFKAIQKAKQFITNAIRFSLDIGKGHGPVNPYAPVAREMAKYHAIEELKEAINILKQKPIGFLIPEVQSNLGFALPYATSPQDIAAIPGRIVAFRDSIATVSHPEFGASRHIAQVILTVMKYDKQLRAAMNIRFDENFLKRCKLLKFRVRSFDRQYEPEKVKEREGSSLKWGIETIVKEEGLVPDIIFDKGDVGKEPMIRVIGRDPMDVVHKILKAGGF